MRGRARHGEAWRVKARAFKMSFVYIISDGEYYKIGFTTGEVQKRVLSLQTGCSSSLSIIKAIETEYPDVLEKELHRRFHHKWIRGEWFDLSKDDLNGIDDLGKVTYGDDQDSSSDFRRSAFDVRPLSGRQFNTTPGSRETISRQRTAFDSSRSQPLLDAVCRKHEECVQTILREERQDDCVGDQQLHDDRTLRHPDHGERGADSIHWLWGEDQRPQKCRPARKRNPQQQRTTVDQLSLELGICY